MARIYGYTEAEITEMAEKRADRQSRRLKRRADSGGTYVAPEHTRDAKTMERDGQHRLVIDPRPEQLRPQRKTWRMPGEP